MTTRDRARASASDGAIPSLVVAIVCKDNAGTIGRTLDSVADLAGAVLAIDSGSTDETIDILERHGASVERSDWLGHVRTKQLALEKAVALPGAQWALCLDSDESLDDALRASVRDAVTGDGGPACYELNRQTWYRGRPLRYVWQPERRVRLVRAGAASWGGLDPHDALLPADRSAPVGRLAGSLRHDSFPTFEAHLRTQWAHATTMARSLHAAGKRGSVTRLLVSPPGAMFKQLVLKRGMLDGVPGLLAAASTAAAALMKHATLLELSRADRRSVPGGGAERAVGSAQVEGRAVRAEP